MSSLSRKRVTAIAAALAALLPLVLLPAAAASGPVGSDRADVRPEQWWLDVLGAERIWDEHTRGKGVVVAVLDSGVDPGGDLQGAVLPGFTYDGTGRGDVETGDAHGTSMATSIAGRGTGAGVTGMAPEATILPVTVTSARRTTEALDQLSAMSDPPEIVNMSYGDVGECSAEMQAAVGRAIDAGMILVASLGNAGPSAGAIFPGNCAGVIVVGAYGFEGNDADGEPILQPWSGNQGAPTMTLSGPGVRIINFPEGDSTPYFAEGTSDAAAITSGSIALVRAAYPDMPSRELVARVLATAFPLDGSKQTGTPDERWGLGTVLPRAAIEDDVPADAPNPVYDALDTVAPPGGENGGSTGPAPTAPGGSGGTASTPDVNPSDSLGGGDDDSGLGSGAITALVVGGLVLVLLVVGGVVLAVVLSGRNKRPAPPY